VADFLRIEKASLDELPKLIGELEHGRALAWARLTQPGPSGAPPALESPTAESPEVGLLRIDEAARRLGMSKSWLYRNASSLPFVVRMNSRNLRFSVPGMERWMRNHSRG
jgi:predicted DNA-binding transcriptional regulator AlpA